MVLQCYRYHSAEHRLLRNSTVFCLSIFNATIPVALQDQVAERKRTLLLCIPVKSGRSSPNKTEVTAFQSFCYQLKKMFFILISQLFTHFSCRHMSTHILELMSEERPGGDNHARKPVKHPQLTSNKYAFFWTGKQFSKFQILNI